MKMMEKLNMPLVSITGTFDSLSYQHSTPDDDQLFEVVVEYEKLGNQLAKLQRKTQNQQKGIVNLKVGVKPVAVNRYWKPNPN